MAEHKTRPEACPTMVELRMQELSQAVADTEASDEKKAEAADSGQVAAFAIAEQLQERVRAAEVASLSALGNAEGGDDQLSEISQGENLRKEIKVLEDKLEEAAGNLATLAAGPPEGNANYGPALQAVHTLIEFRIHFSPEALAPGVPSWSAACDLAPEDFAIMRGEKKPVGSAASFATNASLSSTQLLRTSGGHATLNREWKAACTANQVKEAKDAAASSRKTEELSRKYNHRQQLRQEGQKLRHIWALPPAHKLVPPQWRRL